MCRPLRKDPSHCPRWEKCKINGCSIPQCENMFFSKQSLEAAGENTIPDTVPPLCKYHYHVVYNTYKPTQMYCPTCGTRLRRFFCLCALMFCTNDRCCITDMVDGLGGSTLTAWVYAHPQTHLYSIGSLRGKEKVFKVNVHHNPFY